MEFESPDVAKEFPGLYLGETSKGKAKAMNESLDYEDDTDKKKKKEKKDSKKDKGYAALAGESSHEEEDPTDSKSPGKAKKLKTFKLSTKKKDKKPSVDKENEKEKKSAEKESKKSEKVKKVEKEKERKSVEKETPKSAEKDVIRPRRPFSGENINIIKDKGSPHVHPVAGPYGPTQSDSSPFDAKEGPTTSTSGVVVSTLKEKTSALNAFLNAPAPIFTKKKDKESKDSKKDKDHKEKKEKDKKEKEQKESKKDKEHGVSKVKLKLKRSKNSLEDSHNQSADFPITTSHQFPEDPDSIAKEIRKYEALLEQTHTHIKGSKKVSKKQEEQLWELQRTLTQLKRKLRSVNALSSASSASIMLHHTPNSAPSSASASVEKETVPRKSSITMTAPHVEKFEKVEKVEKPEIVPVAVKSVEREAVLKSPSLQTANDDFALDFTLKTLTSKPTIIKVASIERPVPKILSPPLKVEKSETVHIAKIPTTETAVINSTLSTDVNTPHSLTARRSLDLSDSVIPPAPVNNVVQTCSNEIDSTLKVNSKKLKLQSPSLELERVQVFVQVHRKEKSISPEQAKEAFESEMNSVIDGVDCPDGDAEIIENVLEDANKMIGSIHEELEAAAIVFGAGDEFVSSTPNTAFSLGSHIPPGSNYECNNHEEFMSTNTVPRIFALGPYTDDAKVLTSKSEPTLGDEKQSNTILNSSLNDYENDSDFENFDEEMLADPFTLSVFENDEYLSLENEALALFNEQIQEDISREEAELNALMLQLESMGRHDIDGPEDFDELDDYDNDELIALWQITKLENEALNENVNALRMMVATNKLEEFQLETRLKYLEGRVASTSPLTITTPLQTDV